MLRTLLTLARAQWQMQRRDPAYWVITLGISISIVVVYGSFFANPLSPRLGVVLEDTSPVFRQMIDDLKAVEEIDLTVGARDEELAALADGERWAVLIVPEGASSAAPDPASIRIVYGAASPFESTTGRGLLREAVEAVNRESSGNSGQEGALLREMEVAGSRPAIGLLERLFPGIVGMTLMFGNSWAAGTIVWWRQTGILKRIGCTPLHPLALEVAQLIAFALLSALQVAVLVGLADLLFGVEVQGSYLQLGVVALLGVLTFVAIWYAFAAAVPSTTTFFGLLNLAGFLMVFLGGSAFPLDDIPASLRPVTEVLPLTHLNNALRATINRGEGLAQIEVDIAVLAAWMVAGFAVSARIFRWGRE